MPPSRQEIERARAAAAEKRRQASMNELYGLGDPMQNSYYVEGYRDTGQGDPREKSVVVNPADADFNVTPNQKTLLNTFFHDLKNYLEKNPIFTKRPAFVEAPFFAKPKICHNTIILPALSGDVLILDYKIGDRNRVVVSTVGIDVDPPILLDNQELLFWFAIDGVVVPFFDDQSAAAIALAGFQAGKTTVIPGSTEHPFNLRENGVPLEVRAQGDRHLQIFGRNFSATLAAKLEPLITFYEYWMPESTAFEKGDNQV